MSLRRVAALVAILGVIEGIHFLALCILVRSFDRGAAYVEAVVANVAQGAPEDDREAAGRAAIPRALHPYVGYVNDPRAFATAPRVSNRSQALGLWSVPDILGPARGIRIGVVGGSVAVQIGRQGAEALGAALRRRLPGHPPVEVATLALGGYRQPQSLMTVAYLLTLGAQLDGIILLDGFNEVAMLGDPSFDPQTFPAYPRGWSARLAPLDSERVETLGALYRDLKTRRRRLQLARSPFFALSTTRFYWVYVDRRLAARIARSEDLSRSVQGSAEAMGPPLEVVAPGVDRGTYVIELWARASQTLYALCRGHGIAYLHALQPNQYDPNGKRLNSEERKIAFRAHHPYRPPVVRYYSALRERGRRLAEEGVPFVDLSGLFNDTDTTVYNDACCHFNQPAVERLATELAEGFAPQLTAARALAE